MVLDRYPHAKPRAIMRVLGVFKDKEGKNAHKIRQYKYQWKKRQSYYSEGLNRLSFHGARYFGYVPKFLDRRVGNVTEVAVECGWVLTKAKNRMLQWKDVRLGLLQWYETGRVIVKLRKPYSMANQLQLLADAFHNTGLLFDFRVFTDFAKKFSQKVFSLTYDTGSLLPYSKIEFLKDSNGVVVITGDKSHPRCVEIEYCLPVWAERFEVEHKQWLEVMKQIMTPKSLSPSGDRMVS